jgi:hypothetical protein
VNIRAQQVSKSKDTADYPAVSYGNPPQLTLEVNRAISTVQKWVEDPAAAGFTADDVEWLRRHEQVHFDLMALALRDFLNQVLADPDLANDKEGFKQAALWEKINTRMIALNKSDGIYETNTGLGITPTGKARQKEWSRKIRELKKGTNPDSIGELEKWTPPSIVLDPGAPPPPLDPLD